MIESSRRYGSAPTRPPVSVPVREKVDAITARLMGCSEDHAKRMRTFGVAEWIATILVACRDDATKRENFRRHLLTAASAEPEPGLTPELWLRCQEADTAEDLAEVRHLLEGTTASRDALIRAAERDLALATDRLRALRAEREAMRA